MPASRLRVLGIVLLPIVVQMLVVATFGEDTLLWDEFTYAEAFRDIGDGKPWLHWIWRQHNEHRIIWTKLLLFAHAPLSNWNPIVEMYASALLAGLVTFGLWKIYRAAGGERTLVFLPVSLLVCSLAQYMNMLYGLMTCHYFTMAGMAWSIVLLQRQTWTGLIGAVFAAFAAMVSTLNGVVLWPIGLVVLLITRQAWPRFVVWSIGIAAAVSVYFWDYDVPVSMPPVAGLPLDTGARALQGFVVNLGLPLSAADPRWSLALGVITLIVIARVWAGVWRAAGRERYAGIVALSLIAIGCAAAVGIGRSAFGPGTALESKYVTYATLGPVAAYLGLIVLPDQRWRRPLLAAFVTVLCIGLVAANVYGFNGAAAWQQERRLTKYLLHTIDRQPDDSLSVVFVPSLVRDAAAYLRATRLGPFRHPVDVLSVPRWREGTLTAPITPATPIVARLLCPVETLHDLDLAVGRPPNAPGASQLRVIVQVDGAVAARQEIDERTLRPFQVIRIDLADPIRDCRGKELVVEVSSDTTNAAAAVQSWLYPAFYAGVVRQGDGVVDQRSLGIFFNAVSYGLMR